MPGGGGTRHPATGLDRQVGADLRVPLGQGSADEAAEPLERGIRDPIAGEEAVPPPRDEALREEEGQVLAGTKPLTYTGILKRCTPPEIDSETTTAALIELEMTVSGKPTA